MGTGWAVNKQNRTENPQAVRYTWTRAGCAPAMGKKGGGKKGGKSSPKGKGKKAAADPGSAVTYIDHAKYVRPDTPPPKDMDLPTEVKMAALEGNISRIMQWLDEDNGHVDAQWFHPTAWMQPAAAHQGYTMLMAAAASRAEKLVVLLLDEGASIDMQDAAGDTALMLAARTRLRGYGMHDVTDRIVLTLIQHGASLTLANRRGESASTIVNPMFIGGHSWPADMAPAYVPTRLLTGGGSRPLSASAAYLSPRSQDSTPSFAAAKPMHTAQRYLDRGCVVSEIWARR